jgi:transcriptional regulator with XRE-family HTH domain
MSDFNEFTKEQLARKGVAREYYRLAPFYRLADQLILLRKKRGLTQQELAAKAQTTQAVVSRLENVSVHCSLESVVKLTEALDAVVDVHLTPKEELDRAEILAPAGASLTAGNPPDVSPISRQEIRAIISETLKDVLKGAGISTDEKRSDTARPIPSGVLWVSSKVAVLEQVGTDYQQWMEEAGREPPTRDLKSSMLDSLFD